MKGSIFVFTRAVQSTGGMLRQAITIFAEDQLAAQRMLTDHLSQIGSGHRDSVYDMGPAFTVQNVPLDQPKFISSFFTR
jgi:hypothetical protein